MTKNKEVKGQPKIVDLANTIVHFPDPNTIYRLRSPALPGYETLITFRGTDLHHLQSFDVLLRAFVTSTNSSLRFDLENPETLFISGNSLPFDNTPDHLPSLMYGTNKKQFYVFNKIEFTLDFDSVGNLVDNNIDFSRIFLPHEYKSDNAFIKTKLQQAIPHTNIYERWYPIFLNANRPSFAVLSAIYKNFMRFNPKKKRQQQFKKSIGLCHVRAHFFCMFLKNVYGIESFKIIKKYNSADWNKFRDFNRWGFHCVAVVADDKMRFWVLDPYENVPRLIRAEKFLAATNEPAATEVVISHRLLTNETTKEGAAFNVKDAPIVLFRNIFQFFCTDAIPNKPQYSLSTKQEFIPAKKTAGESEQLVFYQKNSRQPKNFLATQNFIAASTLALSEMKDGVTRVKNFVRGNQIAISRFGIAGLFAIGYLSTIGSNPNLPKRKV